MGALEATEMRFKSRNGEESPAWRYIEMQESLYG